jgi:hypothetical protein
LVEKFTNMREEARMNKLIAFGMAALVWMVSGAAVASAAYSNASLAGTWVCVGGGSTQVKDAKGASSWVPTSLSGIFTLDAKGKFTAVKETNNTGGMTCNYTLGEGSTYSISADGSSTNTINETGAGTNPPQCPATVTGHASVFMQSAASAYGIGTDPNASTWFVCTKRSGK